MTLSTAHIPNRHCRRVNPLQQEESLCMCVCACVTTRRAFNSTAHIKRQAKSELLALEELQERKLPLSVE